MLNANALTRAAHNQLRARPANNLEGDNVLASYPFDTTAAAARCAAEPEFRRFPSLWNTLSARKPGFLDALAQRQAGADAPTTAAMTSAEIERFFEWQKPQLLYPYVWVRNALNPVPDSTGLHAWVHEVWVSYSADDMPTVNAPVRFDHGNLVHLDADELRFGKSPRFDGPTDLVRACCAYVHHGHATEQDDQNEPASASPSP